jgi:hypothetical protein
MTPCSLIDVYCRIRAIHCLHLQVRKIFSRLKVTETGFIDHFTTRIGTARNYSAISNLHTSQITTVHDKSFLACCVFTSRYLVMASNSGDSSTSRAQVNSEWRLPSYYLFSSHTPLQKRLGCPNCLPYNCSARSTQRTPFSYDNRFRGIVFASPSNGLHNSVYFESSAPATDPVS